MLGIIKARGKRVRAGAKATIRAKIISKVGFGVKIQKEFNKKPLFLVKAPRRRLVSLLFIKLTNREGFCPKL